MNSYLREVPEHLIHAVMSGDMKVYGSVIRSISENRIVGHLQETNVMYDMVSSAAGSSQLGPLGAAANLLGQGTTIYQNHKIKAAIDMLQNLQITSLAVGVAGIGVSVAGFAIIAHKITALDKKLDMQSDLLKNIASEIKSLEERHSRSEYSKLRTLAQQMDEAWSLNNPESQWQDVAREAHILANEFTTQYDDLIASANNGLEILMARPLFDACVLASNTRITARMAAGDDIAARMAAQESARTLIDMGEKFDVLKILQKQIEADPTEVDHNKDSQWATQLDAAKAEVVQYIAPVRNSQMAAASLCETLDILNKRSISCRQWLETARDEKEAPLLFLAADY